MSERRLFLSYRREDSAGHAGRLADHLLDRFGQGSVFMDVESLEAGIDFAEAIERAINEADAVLVVIGPGWLDAASSSGSRRLDESEDFVRREIEAALTSDVRVIPVLVGGAVMPAEEDLPPSVAGLTRRNALELLDRRWREDVDALVDVVEGRERGRLGNLPAQPTPFLGRERELAEVIELLRRDDTRLLTLTGPGGIGKTRLAIQAASELAHTYPGGAWLVGLASVTDPDLVIVEVARVIEAREAADGAVVDAIAARLSRGRTLIVLDNVEQLLPDAAAPIAQLSAAAASLELIVTTRQRLHVTAEREFALATLGEDAAVELFVDRARASRGDFALSDQAQRDTVAALCARLDGLPLAIELAASRTRILDPATILRRLDDRFALLTGGARDLPARQQTLRATIDWSYELLSAADRQLFARLSVFASGWTIEAAEEVCHDTDESPDVLTGLESLEQNSLIQRQVSDGRTRFALLETVREYAAELLEASGDRDEISTRHAEHFISEAQLAYSEIRGTHPGAWFERLEPELGNFRLAVHSSLAQGRLSLALRLMAALMATLEVGGYWQEARAVGLDDVLARSEDVHTPERAEVLVAAGSLLTIHGHSASAQSLLEQAVDLALEIGDRRTFAMAMSRLTWAHVEQGHDNDGSAALGEEAVSVARTLGDPWLIAETVSDLASVYGSQGYSPRAIALWEEGLRLRRSITYLPGVAMSLNNLGWQALLAQDYPTAVKYLEESLELARNYSMRTEVIMAQGNLALANLFSGEPERADRLLLENLHLCRESGNRRNGTEALIAFAGTAVQMRDWDRAAWLAGAATAQLDELQLVAADVHSRIRERFLPAARQALGGERYEEEYERGRRATFEEAVAYALDEVAAPA